MRYILLDTETVGLNLPEKGSGVVQIAWLELDKDGNILDEQNLLINPEAPIHPEASKVHGKFDEDVKDCPTLEQAVNFPTACVNISHNAPFDLRFAGAVYQHLAGTICTLQLARQLFPEAKNHKLATLVDYLGLPSFQAHDALADVKATHGVLQTLMQVLERDLESLARFCTKPKVLYTMPFGSHKGKSISSLPMSYIRYFDDKDIDANLRLAFDQQILIRG